ncbi:type II toxin-antitoxin system VapC family toxin [Desertivirga arenae]|uniref:type II toxin-antitoxin system VapC family toxin n=1 Tax=Desertivirga arenae TaxID=2810309 RepID=UPI001A960788|nr:type II toxin-antitoxin system VapC family toxin [Pedobacter sp. SYSU D00823]
MSGNRILLDTNIVLYLLTGDSTLAEFLQEKQAYISIISELELIGFPAISSRELDHIRLFIRSCEVVPINEEIKAHYIALRRKYKIKLGDASIAATALFLDIPLITADKQFRQIEELELTLYDK